MNKVLEEISKIGIVPVIALDKVEDAEAIFRRIQEFQKRFFEGSDVTCE